MQKGARKGVIELECTEQILSEFPELLFGVQIENDVSLFDATSYLHTRGLEKTPKDFFVEYKNQIEALESAYNIPHSEIFYINHQGHILIDGNFVYLFISFVDPNFLAYMCDRIHELMSNGVAVSDTYLLQSAKNRLSREVINTIFADETTAK